MVDPLDLFLDKWKATSSEEKLTKFHKMGGEGAQECSKENVNTGDTKRGDKKEAAIPLQNNTTWYSVLVPCKNKQKQQKIYLLRQVQNVKT